MATAQQVAETKQMVRQAMQEEGVSADTLIRLGQMAEAVLKNKALYPQFVQAVIDSDLAEDGDIPAEIDYQMLGVFATLGEMAKQMMASGELGA